MVSVAELKISTVNPENKWIAPLLSYNPPVVGFLNSSYSHRTNTNTDRLISPNQISSRNFDTTSTTSISSVEY